MDIRAPARVTCLITAACAAAVISAPTALADDPTPAPPPPEVVNQAAATEAQPAAAPTEVPHLSSPQNLPPGTTDVPVNEGPRTSYLRNIWHAIQDRDLTWKDGLLMLAQRPMDPAGIPANPQPPAPEPAPAPPLTP